MKTVLVPTDLSKNAGDTMRYAIEFAKEKKCQLVFLHCFYDAGLDKKRDQKYASIIDLEIERLKSKLKKEIKLNYTSLNIPFSLKKVEVMVLFEKKIVEAIKKEVQKKQIDLIIIGTHGATGLKTVLFGSNTVKVISTTNIPVCVIPLGCKYTITKNILYSTDLLNTKKELEQLNTINEIFRSQIKIVYFDNGIVKIKEEFSGLKVIEKKGLPLDIIKVPVTSNHIKNMTEYLKNKKNTIPCLFHSQKNKMLTFLLGSSTNDLALRFKSPFISIKK